MTRTRKRITWIVLTVSAVVLASFAVQYSGYGDEVEFDWSEANGFAAARVHRPSSSILIKPLAASFDWLIVLQARSRIASYFRGMGWKQARGQAVVKMVWPLPIVLELNGMGNWKIIDPTVTPLIEGAKLQDMLHASELLASGADVNAKDQNGATALTYARDRDLIRMLISAGADVNVKSSIGNSPLYDAVCLGNDTSLVEELLSAGANINVTYGPTMFLLDVNTGLTPLMCATKGLWFEDDAIRMVRVILSAGADVNARDSQGRTALSIAEENHYSHVAEILKQVGATP